MTDVEAFLEAVSSADSEDARIIKMESSAEEGRSLRFLPLNPANHFHGVFPQPLPLPSAL